MDEVAKKLKELEKRVKALEDKEASKERADEIKNKVSLHVSGYDLSRRSRHQW